MSQELRIYSLNLRTYHTSVLIAVIILYIISLVFIHLITESLYLLTTFFQFPLPQLLASGTTKSDLFFYEFGSSTLSQKF